MKAFNGLKLQRYKDKWYSVFMSLNFFELEKITIAFKTTTVAVWFFLENTAWKQKLFWIVDVYGDAVLLLFH